MFVQTNNLSLTCNTYFVTPRLVSNFRTTIVIIVSMKSQSVLYDAWFSYKNSSMIGVWIFSWVVYHLYLLVSHTRRERERDTHRQTLVYFLVSYTSLHNHLWDIVSWIFFRKMLKGRKKKKKKRKKEDKSNVHRIFRPSCPVSNRFFEAPIPQSRSRFGISRFTRSTPFFHRRISPSLRTSWGRYFCLIWSVDRWEGTAVALAAGLEVRLSRISFKDFDDLNCWPK